MDVNEFSSIFFKVHHFHPRHQKTTSNFKGTLRFSIEQPLEGAMLHINPWENCQGNHNFFSSIFSKYWCFRQNNSQGFLEFIKLYKQNPLSFFFFTVNPNYTLALTWNVYVHVHLQHPAHEDFKGSAHTSLNLVSAYVTILYWIYILLTWLG